MYSTVQSMGADTSRMESLKVIPKFPREGTYRVDTIYAIVHSFLAPSLEVKAKHPSRNSSEQQFRSRMIQLRIRRTNK